MLQTMGGWGRGPWEVNFVGNLRLVGAKTHGLMGVCKVDGL
jgi:hypothetical protein